MPHPHSEEVHTTVFDIHRGQAWVAAIAFMAAAWTPTLWEHAAAAAKGEWSRTPAARLLSWRPSHGPLSKTLNEVDKSFHDFAFAVAARRSMQLWLTEHAQHGNRKVHIGYNGMLFYEPDLRALTGRGPLAPEPAGAQPDPELLKTPSSKKAVIQFAAQLKERGIPLLLVPVPLKPMIYPEFVTANTSYEWMAHPDAAALYGEFRANGIDVVDLTADLARLRNRRRHIYVRVPDAKDKAAVAEAEAEAKEPMETFMRQDTHWTPEAMQLAAERISAHVKRSYPIAIRPRFKEITAVDSIQRESMGDLVKFLDLADPEQIFFQEPVLLKVVGEGTEDRDSPIVLLGDSFVTVFDDPALGFGNPSKPGERIRAGFAQNLALRLQQPLDVIALNGKGSTGVRKIFAARPDDEVRAKKLVIWVLASRDLFLSRSAARDANVEWAEVTFTPGRDPRAGQEPGS